ncbi:MAG TPA: BON domain-containing protein [Nitrospira sp.]|nr:BON domain-containing protein [Nitrospira sp.]
MACQAPISQAPTGKTALESLNDDSIKASVQGKLAADNVQDMNVVAFANVVVQAERGAVILSGVVQTSEQKARAEQLAGEVNGVTHVTNNLQVRTGKKR